MAEWLLLPDGVSKKILSGGKGNLPDYVDGAKVKFNFRSLFVKDNGERQLLDDSKVDDHPFELLLGKKFKLDIWETLIKTMRIDEVAEFICEPKHVATYPVVSKSLRDMYKKHNHHHTNEQHSHTHQCGFAALSQGLGYNDLDEYVNDPKPIVFLMELLKVELPGTYEVDVWSLSLDEKLKLIPKWKDEGNNYYRQGNIDSACDKYSQALGALEQLTTREKPGSPEWLELEAMKVPLLLNYSQCMLSKKEHYKAIEHLTTVIQKDPSNVKGFYRRAKAYHCIFDYQASREDYKKVQELDKSLTNTIEKELKQISLDEKQKDLEDRKKFKNAFG